MLQDKCITLRNDGTALARARHGRSAAVLLCVPTTRRDSAQRPPQSVTEPSGCLAYRLRREAFAYVRTLNALMAYTLVGATARWLRATPRLDSRILFGAASLDCGWLLVSAPHRAFAGRGGAAAQDSNTQRGSSAVHAQAERPFVSMPLKNLSTDTNTFTLKLSLQSVVCLPPGMAAHFDCNNRASGGTYQPPAVRGQERRRNA